MEEKVRFFGRGRKGPEKKSSFFVEKKRIRKSSE